MTRGEFFRAGVAIIVLRADGMVLGLERLDVPGSWQIPQGGVALGEELVDAAGRELFEETGISWHDIDLLDEHPAWLTYELPPEARSTKTGRGQALRFFLGRLVSEETRIVLKPDSGEQEFRDWRWMTTADLMATTWQVKHPAYRAAFGYWSAHLR